MCRLGTWELSRVRLSMKEMRVSASSSDTWMHWSLPAQLTAATARPPPVTWWDKLGEELGLANTGRPQQQHRVQGHHRHLGRLPG